MQKDKRDGQEPRENLIKENIRRAFVEKEGEALPPDLLNLLAQLRAQDDSDGSR